jgi:HK97 family phage major capsid protein
MTIRDLREQRDNFVQQMRAMVDAQGADAEAIEETHKWKSLRGQFEAIEEKIKRQEFLDEAERRMAGEQISGNGDHKLDAELRNFSLRKAICSRVPDLADLVDCGREREISQEISRRSGFQFQGIPVPMQIFEKRVLTTAAPVGGPGSNLISTDYLGNQFIDILREKLVLRQLGARVLSGLVGNVSIPKWMKSAVAGWFAENAAITPSDPEILPVQLTPKHVGCITEFTRPMLLQASPDIEQLLRDDFAGVLARAVDRAGIKGGGANEPDGILESGIDLSVSMASPSWESVLELVEAVEVGNAEGSAFLTNPPVVTMLRSTPKVSSTDSVMIMQGRNMLADYPLSSTNLVPASTIIFGDFSQVLIGYWSVLDVLVNPYSETAYTKGNVLVRGIITADVAIRHVEAFAASDDVALS